MTNCEKGEYAVRLGFDEQLLTKAGQKTDDVIGSKVRPVSSGVRCGRYPATSCFLLYSSTSILGDFIL